MRIAAVQPRSHTGEDEHRNVDDALRWLERSVEAGADLVIFPEGYPGPTNPANRYDALTPLAAAAADAGVAVIAGHVTPAHAGTHHVTLSLIGPDGRVRYRYQRTTPVGPYVYRDIPAWNFDYREGGAVPEPQEVAGVTVGMLVCSEVYVPELSRGLALQGAQLLAYPAGGAINELLDSWRTVVRARAIENLAYTVVCQNLYDDREKGVGLIASPEGDVVVARGEDLLIADVDRERLAYLRSEDEHIVFPKPYRTIPGVLRWRRPSLYGALTDPQSQEPR